MEMVGGDASENVSDQSLVVLNKLVACICSGYTVVTLALLNKIDVLYDQHGNPIVVVNTPVH
jgi:hypothetical protein